MRDCRTTGETDSFQIRSLAAASGQKKRGVFRRPALLDYSQSNYTQVITPGVVTPESHFFAERACAAVAVHEGGGPTSAVASTVTSFEGVKP